MQSPGFPQHPEQPILSAIHFPARSGSLRFPSVGNRLLPRNRERSGKWLSLNLYPRSRHESSKTAALLRLCRYFKSRKGEPRFFNKRNICLLAAAGAYILTPDEFLFDGIGRLGLLDDAAVILGAVLTVFFPDGD